MERKRRREENSASCEVPQQSKPIKEPEPVLTVSFIKKEGCESVVIWGGKMVPQQRSLITESSASILLVETLGTTSRPLFCVLVG